jgi:hypothetical protein
MAASGAPEEPITEGCSGPIHGGSALRVCGTLNPGASAKVGYYFAYNVGPVCTGGESTPLAPEVEGESVAVAGELTGLAPNTDYSYCLVATNSRSATVGQALSYMTGPAPPQAPITGCSGVTPAQPSWLHVCGTLNPGASAKVGYYFAYNVGPICTGGDRTPPGPEVEGEDVNVAGELTGLTPNTEYSYCLVAKSEDGEAFGADLAFMTQSVPPEIAGESASSITQTAATLQAKINPNNAEATPSFQYSTSESLANATIVPGGPIAAALQAEPVSVAIVGLQPGTVYYFQALAANSAGKAEGPVESFTTPPAPPLENAGGTPGTVPGMTTLVGGTTDSDRTTQSLIGKVKPKKASTTAQKLARALSACKTRPKKQRASCQRKAHKTYGAKSKKAKKR